MLCATTERPMSFIDVALCADSEPVSVSDACREEVYQYKIARNANINMNIPLGG